jgi:hypothetical protein
MRGHYALPRERGLEVDAVEGSLLRAECAAERCRDLGNVRVFAENLASVKATRKYDVVTLIASSNMRAFSSKRGPGSRVPRDRAQLSHRGRRPHRRHRRTSWASSTSTAAPRTISGRPTRGSPTSTPARPRRRSGRWNSRPSCGWPDSDVSIGASRFPDYKTSHGGISTAGLMTGNSPRATCCSENSRATTAEAPCDRSTNRRCGACSSATGCSATSPTPSWDGGVVEGKPLDDGAWLAYRFSPQRLRPFAARTRFTRNRRRHRRSKDIVDPSGRMTPVGVDGEFRVQQRLGDSRYVRGRLFARELHGRGRAGIFRP